MSDQDRKKKDGRNKDKKNKLMRNSVKERAHSSGSQRPSADQPGMAPKG